MVFFTVHKILFIFSRFIVDYNSKIFKNFHLIFEFGFPQLSHNIIFLNHNINYFFKIIITIKNHNILLSIIFLNHNMNYYFCGFSTLYLIIIARPLFLFSVFLKELSSAILILLQHHVPFRKYGSWILNVNSPSIPIWSSWCSPFSSSSLACLKI